MATPTPSEAAPTGTLCPPRAAGARANPPWAEGGPRPRRRSARAGTGDDRGLALGDFGAPAEPVGHRAGQGPPGEPVRPRRPFARCARGEGLGQAELAGEFARSPDPCPTARRPPGQLAREPPGRWWARSLAPEVPGRPRHPRIGASARWALTRTPRTGPGPSAPRGSVPRVDRPFPRHPTHPGRSPEGPRVAHGPAGAGTVRWGQCADPVPRAPAHPGRGRWARADSAQPRPRRRPRGVGCRAPAAPPRRPRPASPRCGGYGWRPRWA